MKMKKTSLLLTMCALMGLSACGTSSANSSLSSGYSSSSSSSSSSETNSNSSGSSNTGYSSDDSSEEVSKNVIKVAASDSPHAEILDYAVQPLFEEKGYILEIEALDWTNMNDSVYNGYCDANYFQHRPYLQTYDSDNENIEFSEDYVYQKLFPVVGVHFEPLRVYPGKSRSDDFEEKKALSNTTYCIPDDSFNGERAIALLKDSGIVSEETTMYNITYLYPNIALVSEYTLAAFLPDYDYGILPASTALMASMEADASLPMESDSVKAYRAAVVAANVTRYASDSIYKTKIDVLADALLDDSVADYIASAYGNVVADARVRLPYKQ